MFDFLGGKRVEIVDVMLKNLEWDGRLDVGRLRLHALVADRWNFAELVRHATVLPAHAQGACLSGVMSRHALCGFCGTPAATRIQPGQDLPRASAEDLFGHFLSFPGADITGEAQDYALPVKISRDHSTFRLRRESMAGGQSLSPSWDQNWPG